jgi:type I restriction enzyme S subunit
LIAELKPYTEYKESGLPWLAQVPRHWQLIPNRGLVRKKKVLVGNRHGDYQLLSLTKQGVIVRDISTGKGKFSSDVGTSQEVRTGDFVFCLFDVPETPRTVGLSHHDGMITGAYTVFESLRKGNSQYFELFYRALDDRKLLSPLYSGLRNTIPTERFLGTKTPQPPPEEQAAIVRFLDWTNGRLERAIKAKRKVIALLNEQKQAIIHRAVTRGLDPSGPLSTDSIPFLDHLPARWPVFRAKLLFRQVVSPIPDGAEIVTCFRDGEVTLRRNRRTTGFTNAIWELGYQGITTGQLVLHSMDAFAGAIGVSDSSGKCSPEYVICEPAIQGVLSDYYAHLLRNLALRGLFVALCPSVRERAPRVRFNDFGSFVLPKPPASEQRQIVEYIRNACGKIDTSLATIRRQENLLREYRTRLVADVVTGKLDVREAVAKLPDETLTETAEDEVDLENEARVADEEAEV